MERHYDNPEDALKAARKLTDMDLISYSKANGGSRRSIAAAQVLKEREAQAQKDLQELKLKREEPHTLLAYWRRGTSSERFGVLGCFGLLILLGFTAASIPWVKTLLQLIKDLKP